MAIIRYFLKIKANRKKGADPTGMLTVLSNKGGVGKTSLAVSIAIACSEIFNKKTLLVELDCSPGDIGLILDVSDEKSLDFIIDDPSSYKRYFKKYSRNLDVIKGLRDPLAAEKIEKERICHFLSLVKRSYDIIVIDTQTVLNGLSVDALRSSENIALISDFTFESIFRVKKLYEILVKKFLIDKKRFKLILNKKNIFSELRSSDISRMTDLPILDFIPLDRKFDKFSFLLNKNSTVRTRFFKKTKILTPRLFN